MVQNGEVSTKIFLDLKTIDMLTHTTQDNTRKQERTHWNRGLQSWSYVESWICSRSSSIKFISYGQGYQLKIKQINSLYLMSSLQQCHNIKNDYVIYRMSCAKFILYSYYLYIKFMLCSCQYKFLVFFNYEEVSLSFIS